MQNASLQWNSMGYILLGRMTVDSAWSSASCEVIHFSLPVSSTLNSKVGLPSQDPSSLAWCLLHRENSRKGWKLMAATCTVAKASKSDASEQSKAASPQPGCGLCSIRSSRLTDYSCQVLECGRGRGRRLFTAYHRESYETGLRAMWHARQTNLLDAFLEVRSFRGWILPLHHTGVAPHNHYACRTNCTDRCGHTIGRVNTSNAYACCVEVASF